MTGPPGFRPHQFSEGLLIALAAGGGGPEAIEALKAIQFSRNRLLTLAVVELADRVGHPEAEAARAAYRTLVEIERVAPRTVRQLLCYPTTSAWLATTVTALHQRGCRGETPEPPGVRPGEVRPARLGLVAAAAAVRAAVPVSVPAESVGPGPHLLLPALGQAWLPGGTGDALRVTPDRDDVILARGAYRLRLGEPARWAGLPWVSCGEGRFRFAASIDGAGWRLLPGGGPDPRILADVAPADTRRWRDQVQSGWRLLTRHHQPVAGEVAAVVGTLVPLRTPGGALVSGTFRDGFGAVAMSLPADARSVALTLAHEVQHAKLVGVMDAFPLVEPGVEERFYAPWRRDPRPLGALLHGAYAHVGVTAFWRAQRWAEESAEETFAAQVAFARWRSATWAATEAVRHTGRLTPAGMLMLDGMRARLREFLADPVPAEAQRRADALAARHRHRAAPGR